MGGCTVKLTIEGRPGGPFFYDDALVALLQATGTHLEGGRGGSRFPSLWAICVALQDEHDEWMPDELEALEGELRTVLDELAAVPASETPTFMFGDEGYPDIFSAVSPRLSGTAASRFGGLLERILGVVAEARAAGAPIRLDRTGPRVAWWDGAGSSRE